MWQKIDETCQTCHSWRDPPERSITAMTTIVVLALVLLTVAAGSAWLWRTVVSDGSGRRRAPEHGHAHWSSSVPDAPYRSLDRVA